MNKEDFTVENGTHWDEGSNYTATVNTSSPATAIELKPWMVINLSFYYYVIGFGALERLIGSVVNLCVLLVIRKHRRLRTPANVLVFNLALADSFGCVPAPIEIATAVLWSNENTSWKYTCYIETFLGATCWLGNIIGIHLIAWERFLSVHFPIWSRRKISINSMVNVSVVQWMILFLLVGIVLAAGNVGTGNEVVFCSWNLMSTLFYILTYLFVVLSVGTLVLYLKIVHATIKRQKLRATAVHSLNVNIPETRRREKNARITKSMLIVIGVYYILYLPSVINDFVVRATSYNYSSYVTYSLYLFFMLNTICNPFIYFFLSNDFKNSFKMLFG